MFWKLLHLMQRFPILQNIRILFFFFDSVVLLFLKKPQKCEGKKKVLLVFPLALGDAIMMYGSLYILRDIYPKDLYEIHIMCQKEYMELFRPVCDTVVEIDYRNANIGISGRIAFLKKCREIFYDVLIDPTGMEECTPGVYTANAVMADEKIGVISARDKKYQTPKWLMQRTFTRVIRKEEKNVHRVRYYTEVFSELAGKKYTSKLADIQIGKKLVIPEQYIVVFPSASTEVKRWPLERYIKLTDNVLGECGLPIVVCGSEGDRTINEKYKEGITDSLEIIDMTGCTSVMQLIELIGRATLVITNDTGIYHIAVAMKRKICCITGAYVYSSFIDYCSEGLVDEEDVVFIAHKKDCMDCDNNCIWPCKSTYPCVLENTQEEVELQVKNLLRRERR